MKFTAKIANHAKEENKLVKVCADDINVLKVLEKSLGSKVVEFGFKGSLTPNEA